MKKNKRIKKQTIQNQEKNKNLEKIGKKLI